MTKVYLDGYYDIEVRKGVRTYDTRTYSRIYLGDFEELIDQLNKSSFLGFTKDEDQIILPTERIHKITRSFDIPPGPDAVVDPGSEIEYTDEIDEKVFESLFPYNNNK